MNTTKHTMSFILYCMLSLQACSAGNGKPETYDQYRTQQIEPRDSLFVLHTVKEWGKADWWTWGVRSYMYKITSEEVEYFIAGTFYNKDKTKVLVWVGVKKPNAPTIEKYRENPEANKICPNATDTIYSLSALIGFRDSLNQPWKLYPFNQQQATCYANKEEVINVLGQYYFVQMKTHQMYKMMQTGIRNGHKELQAYGYNLQDKDFFDKCWLFPTGPRLEPGLS